MRAQTGIAGYDLKSPADLALSFDYNSTGSADHLVFYRPGTGTIYIVENVNGSFTTVFQSTTGIGSFDLMSPDDRIISFDYDGNGYKDHLLLYRPGVGAVQIVAHAGNSFHTVFQSSAGIGSFDLRSTNDHLIAFDFLGNGLSTYLVAYRPGSGVVHILENQNGTFVPVYQTSNGLGGFDLSSASDRIVAFDFTGLGIADHLVLYRPGAGMVSIMANYGGTFTPVFQSMSGIGGYDLASPADRLVAVDYEGTGNLDHLLAYRPGTGTAFILGSSYFAFSPVFESRSGIAGFDLESPADRVISFDSSGTGEMKDLVFYRPGSGAIEVASNTAGTYTSMYQSF